MCAGHRGGWYRETSELSSPSAHCLTSFAASPVLAPSRQHLTLIDPCGYTISREAFAIAPIADQSLTHLTHDCYINMAAISLHIFHLHPMSSSSTSFHVFAIAGAIGGSGNDGPSGSLGSFIVDELLKAGAEVHVLARAASVSLLPMPSTKPSVHQRYLF